MQKTIRAIEDLSSDMISYVHTHTELLKAKTIEKFSEVLSEFLVRIVFFLVFFLFLVFLGMSMASLLVQTGISPWLSYFIVACAFLLVAILALLLKNHLFRNRIMDLLIQKFYQQDEKDQQPS